MLYTVAQICAGSQLAVGENVAADVQRYVVAGVYKKYDGNSSPFERCIDSRCTQLYDFLSLAAGTV